MKSVFFSFVLALTALFSFPIMKQLENIEVIINDEPEKAINMLSEIKEGIFQNYGNNEKVIAKYSLLQAIALDKCYIDTADVSIIQPAVDYYSKHGTRVEKNRMHYYFGRILENGADPGNAILEYEKSLSYAIPENHHFNGLVYSSIAYVYTSSHNDREALEYAQRSLASFKESGELENIKKAEYSLGIIMHNLQHYELADSLFREVLGDMDSLQIHSHAAEVFARNLMAFDVPKSNEAVNVFSMMQEQCIPFSSEDITCYAYALLLEGETEKARRLLAIVGDVPSDYKSQVWRRRIAIHEGDYELAHILVEKKLAYEDEYIKDKLEQSLFKVKSENSRLLAEKAIQERRFAVLSFVLAFMALFILSFVIATIAIRKKRESEKETKRLLSVVEESSRLISEMEIGIRLIEEEKNENNHKLETLEDELSKSKDSVFHLRQSYISLFRKQFEQINNVLEPNWQTKGREVQSLLHKPVDELLNILSDSSSQKALEELVDSNLSGIITSIRKDFPRFTDEDIRFICYMIIGFDNTSISILMNMTGENVRVKRHRLKNKIADFENGKYTGYLPLLISKTVTY